MYSSRSNLKLGTESFSICFQKFFRKSCRQRTLWFPLCEAELSAKLWLVGKWQPIPMPLCVTKTELVALVGLVILSCRWLPNISGTASVWQSFHYNITSSELGNPLTTSLPMIKNHKFHGILFFLWQTTNYSWSWDKFKC